MKARLQFVSTIALLFDLCTIWCAFTDRPGESISLIWASWVLALAVGVMSVVHASRLRRPGWAAVSALVTLCVVGGGCAALADILAHPDGFFPSAVEGIAVPLILLLPRLCLRSLLVSPQSCCARAGRCQRMQLPSSVICSSRKATAACVAVARMTQL